METKQIYQEFKAGEKIREHILKNARPIRTPDQQNYPTLSLSDCESISRACGVSKRSVEIAALDAGVVPQRYLRNIGSLGIEGQKKLLQAKALLVGVGGLGGTIAQLLARMGLGRLVIADGDCFTEDNLNRQAFSSEQGIGLGKVQVAQSEIHKINSAVEVEIYDRFITEQESATLLKESDVAIDALDKISSRFMLEKICKQVRVPLVHGAVAGFNGQVMTIFPEDSGLEAIYGSPRIALEKGAEVELGNLAGIVSATASLQVQEVVKIITGLGRSLRNRFLFLDSLNGAAEIIALK